MHLKNTAKRQHYVPRLLLKRFTDSKEHLWVFDKWERKTFESSIEKVAAENFYYNYKVSGVLRTLENELTGYESKASIIIDSIVESNSLLSLTDDDKYKLSEFISLQYLRTPFAFEQTLNFYDQLMSDLSLKGISPEQVEGYEELTDESLRLWRLSILSDFKMFTNHFYNKTWFLQASTPTSPFWISDNPISFQNSKRKGERSNIGLEVDGIEVYLPLTKDLTLVLWCGDTTKYICEQYKLMEKELEFKKSHPEQFKYIENVYNCIKNGQVFACTDSNVTNLNSLQVKYSSRFIFSSNHNFSLAQEMIDSQPQYIRQR